MTGLASIPIVLKRQDWPTADREAWDALFAPGLLFEDEGPCVDCATGTRHIRQQAYGQWLSFLVRNDPESLALTPAQRITQPRVDAYIAECRTRLRRVSVHNIVVGLAVLANVLSPSADWSWLGRAVTRLRHELGQGDLKAAPSITAAEVFHWSLRRMTEVHADPALRDIQHAIAFRQALMIGFLISCPVRRRALLAMTVTSHVKEAGEGFQLHFSAEDMKDQKARKYPLICRLEEPMRLYLDFYRLILLGDNRSDGLWISQYGEPLTAEGVSRELPDVTMRHLGVALRPHAFRHIAATSIAEVDPEHVGIIRDLLGHATLDMAEKHYNRAGMVRGCNELQSIIRDIRRKARRMAERER